MKHHHQHGGRGNEEREGDFDKEGTLSKENAAHGKNDAHISKADSEGRKMQEEMAFQRSSNWHPKKHK